MKSAASVLALIAVPVLVFSACSQGDVVQGTGGSSSGGTSSPAAGTNSPAAGTNPTTAGTPSTTGGNSAAGTSTGMSGSMNTGGVAGGSGPTGGSGGAPGGGNPSGGASMAGTAGAPQGGGGTDLIKQVTGVDNGTGDTFTNAYFLLPCYKQDAQDCVTIPTTAACPPQTGPFETQGFTQTEKFTLGGTAGTNYAMTFNVNGISEGKYYQGGKRDAGDTAVANADSDAGTDTFYVGGTPVAQEHYNIYKMTVKKPDGTELQHYYLNSFPINVGRYENHNTFALHYTKTITVPGGGSIELFIGDSNCHAVDNCGPGEYAGTCTKSRNIPEPNFVMPTKYMGKNVSDLNVITGAKQPYHAQLIHIGVTAVVPM